MLTSSASISFSVLAFFVTAIIGWFSGLSQPTCCKRALIAAVIIYVVFTIFSKLINYILTEAYIESELKKQQKEQVK